MWKTAEAIDCWVLYKVFNENIPIEYVYVEGAHNANYITHKLNRLQFLEDAIHLTSDNERCALLLNRYQNLLEAAQNVVNHRDPIDQANAIKALKTTLQEISEE